MNILKGLLFLQKSSIIDVRLGYIQASENIDIFKEKLSWSKLSQLLQRIAFSCFDYTCNVFNFCVNEGKDLNILKEANVSPAFKKCDRGSKESYHSLSILHVIVKIFEKLLNQVTLFMDACFWKCQCVFRNSFMAPQCLLAK